jgi:Exostosin family
MPDIRKLAGLAVTVAVVCTMGVTFYEVLATNAVVKDLLLAAATTTTTTSRTAGSNVGERTRLGFDGVGLGVAETKSLCDANGTLMVSTPATPESLLLVLNDRSIELSPCVDRPWLTMMMMMMMGHSGTGSGGGGESESTALRRRQRPQRRNPPPYKVLLTNFEWNHHDQTIGLNKTRSIRATEILMGVVNHPYFDPTDWDEVNRRVVEDASSSGGPRNETTRFYVFLDAETCYETNYPVYGGGVGHNLDTTHGRVGLDRYKYNRPNLRAIDLALTSPLFRAHPNRTKLVYLDCYGRALPAHLRERIAPKRSVQKRQFAYVSISAADSEIDSSIDQGLPPPPVNPISLTPNELRDVETCAAEANRTYLFSFVGSVRNKARTDLVSIHNKSIGVISLPLRQYQREQATNVTPISFSDLLRGSVFAGTPVGDNLFSYRFAEVLSAGAIPVVHSDGWVLPFRPELVDWSECLLHLPESTIRQTIDILNSISTERRCRMRQRCLEIYNEYMTDAASTIRGILDGLELVATRGESPAAPLRRRHLHEATANRVASRGAGESGR